MVTELNSLFVLASQSKTKGNAKNDLLPRRERKTKCSIALRDHCNRGLYNTTTIGDNLTCAVDTYFSFEIAVGENCTTSSSSNCHYFLSHPLQQTLFCCIILFHHEVFSCSILVEPWWYSWSHQCRVIFWF